MKPQDLTIRMQVDQTPEKVFNAIRNVRGWWSEELEGSTDKLGASFGFRYKNLHESTHEITELVRGKKVVWKTVKAHMSFLKNKREWDGTEVVFEIAKRGKQTEVKFTHVGLVPTIQCFGDCSGAWGYHLGSLRDLINTGKGYPNRAGKDAYADPAGAE